MKTEKTLLYAVCICFILNLYSDPTVRLLGSAGKYAFISLFFLTVIWRYVRDELPGGVIHHDWWLFGLLGMLVLLFGISAFFSQNRIDVAKNLLSFLILLAFLYLITRHFLALKGKDAIFEISEIFLGAIVFSFVLGAVLVLLLDLDMMEVDFTGGRYRRGFGFFLGDRMAFGFLSNLGLFLSIFLYRRGTRHRRKKFCYLSLAALFFLCALLSNTRTAYLFLFMLFLFLVKYDVFDRITWPPRYTLILFTFLAVVSISIYFFNSYSDRITDRDVLNQFSTGRLIIWYLALQLLAGGNPLFGLGFKVTGSLIRDNFLDMSPYFAQVSDLSLHSSYIEILSSAGVFGLLTFIILAGVVFFKLKDVCFRAFTISLLAIATVASFLVIPNIPISAFFWILLFYTGLKPQGGCIDAASS